MLIFTGPSNGNVKEPNVESSFEQQAAADTPERVFRPSSEQQGPLEEEKKAYGTKKEVASLSAKASLQTGNRPNISQSTPDLGMELYLLDNRGIKHDVYSKCHVLLKVNNKCRRIVQHVSRVYLWFTPASLIMEVGCLGYPGASTYGTSNS